MSDTKLPLCLLMLVLILLLLPLQWLGAAMIAATVHELGHYIAARFMGGRICGMKVGATGAMMDAVGLSQKEELACLIAGPLAGLLLGLTFPRFPLVAICGIVQSVYNLLPIYPLDGGRILRCIASILGTSNRFCKTIEYAVLTFLFALCIYVKVRFRISTALLLHFGILLLRKTSCKAREEWI